MAPPMPLESRGHVCKVRSASFGSRSSRAMAASVAPPAVGAVARAPSGLTVAHAAAPILRDREAHPLGHLGRRYGAPPTLASQPPLPGAWGAHAQLRGHPSPSSTACAMHADWCAPSPRPPPVAQRAAAAAAELRAEFRALRTQQQAALANGAPLSAAAAAELLSQPICCTATPGGGTSPPRSWQPRIDASPMANLEAGSYADPRPHAFGGAVGVRHVAERTPSSAYATPGTLLNRDTYDEYEYDRSTPPSAGSSELRY